MKHRGDQNFLQNCRAVAVLEFALIVKNILIAVVDGLKGFPEAINAVFPQTLVQTCIVHLLRNSLACVSWQDRRQAVAALKPIYQVPTADAALLALNDFEAGPWGRKYPAITPTWRHNGIR